MLSVIVTRRFAETVAMKGAGAEGGLWQKVVLAIRNNIFIVVTQI